MSAPNPQLVAALLNSPAVPKSPLDEWNAAMTTISTQIELDRYDSRGNSYNRNAYTAAALLAGNNRLRDLVLQAGGNLKQFDTVVALAQNIMAREATKPIPAVKIANVLNKL